MPSSSNVQNAEAGAPRSREGHVAVARQAIVDEHRAVFGYKLFERPRPAANDDDAMLFEALGQAGTTGLAGRKTVFVHCSFENMADGYLSVLDPDRVVLEIPTLRQYSAEGMTVRRSMLVKAREAGFQLGFDQSVLHAAYAGWLALASFVRIDSSGEEAAGIEQLVRTVRALSGATVIAGRIDDTERYERMKRLGIKLFQGDWLSAPAQTIDPAVQASQATVLRLINLVREEAELDDIEELLKKDPMLSFKLLRFINSSGFGLTTEVKSFRHAVMILGLNKLFRWATLLMTTARPGGAAPAAGTTAVVRGRLMELLALETGLSHDQCDQAFVTGVFSQLDILLGLPLERALSELNLPASITDALLHGRGGWAPYLSMTKACENGDEAVFDAAARQLGLSTWQVNGAHLQALIWADLVEQ
ncbi:MAG: HDOD domain-containing protein [Comamonadaceae bacterium]|nr:MAG: HDOD domain-containing protein [Comamonadaceae bacterium]